MKPTVEDLVRKALKLDQQDRAEVAARLLESLDDDEDEARGRSRTAASRPSGRFETRVFDLGPCRLGNLDDIAKALAFAEGEAFK